jgi:hypothetical protein
MPNESSPYPPILFLQDQLHYCPSTLPRSSTFPPSFRSSISSFPHVVHTLYSSFVLRALCVTQNLMTSWFQQSSHLSTNPQQPILEHHQSMFPLNVANFFPTHVKQWVKLQKVKLFQSMPWEHRGRVQLQLHSSLN